MTPNGDSGNLSMGNAMGLPEVERSVLRVLDDLLTPGLGAVSGHDLRLAVQRQGFAKPAVVLAMQALVELRWLERVRQDESDGRFFTAYRRVR